MGRPTGIISRQWICLVCIALLAGCSRDDPDLVPITGRVTLNDQSVAELIVTFTPIGSTPGSGSLGATDHDGQFSLTDVRGGAGGYTGEYRVSVYPAPAADTRDLPTDVVSSGSIGIPGVFLNPNRSPLRATVPAAGGDFQVKLTSTGAEAAVIANPTAASDAPTSP